MTPSLVNKLNYLHECSSQNRALIIYFWLMLKKKKLATMDIAVLTQKIKAHKILRVD